MGLFNKIKGCKIIKESNLQEEIKYLESLIPNTLEEKEKLEKEIKLKKFGLNGENKVLFELKNSNMPMLVLHDVYYEFEDKTAQIDFLVVTRDKIYIIECKNMLGDILITQDGSFIRNVNNETKQIYSPLTQCERHQHVLFSLLSSRLNNKIHKFIFEKLGDTAYKTLVVITNPNSKVSKENAPSIIKNRVVAADQLNRYIYEHHNKKNQSSEKEMISLANYLLELQSVNPKKYLNKFNKKMICPRCGSDMILREAKKGNNKGNKFYGCKRYPLCRTIVNIKKENN